MSDTEWGRELPRLTGGRVELRGLRADDAEALFAVFGDPEVVQYWSSPALEDLEQARELVREIQGHFEARRLFQWGICRKDGGEVIGTCTLLGLDRTHRRAEVGIALGRSAWGQGLATEALGVLIEFCFETLGLQRLEADADPENERSLSLLERQGFRREGLLRERWQHLGQARDAVFLGLLRREWSRDGTLREPD